jgi:two-component system LytT family response regulator
MKIKAIIIEDEKMSREILASYLDKYCPAVEVIGMAKDVKEGLELLRNASFELLFLDIELPFGNAFDILDSKGNKEFETIFVTAYEKYAKEALNKHAAYYILKPISIDELIRAVDYVQEKLSVKNEKPLPDPIEKIAVSDNKGMELIPVKDIIYLRAQDNYTEMILEKRKILSSKALKHYDDKLSHSGFVRIHRSYFVNISHIEKYIKGSGGYVLMSNGDHLDVSAKKKEALLKHFK